MTKEEITALARKHGTSYTNRHAPGEPAFAFGNEAWANFVDALVAAQPAGTPLADAQLLTILAVLDSSTKRLPPGFRQFARAIEAAHGIKPPRS